MLNIIADALLLATRMGRPNDDHLPRNEQRRTRREFMEIDGLHTADYLRNQGR